MKKIILSSAILVVIFCKVLIAQNPLVIPPALTGITFNLNIQNGVTQFYPGINTATYGINGASLAPTLMVNKGEWVLMNVTNNLTGSGNSTTIHWHGLHVPAADDGGPHQVIEQGATWNPQFQILNSAGSYWYHPHGDAKTELHVSKGIAGMIIVKDSIESAITLPRTYGVDDFPIIVQSKAFDVQHQIAISTEMDTAICVNGTIQPFLDVPAQIIRLRLLNGSSMRTYNFGFSSNISFKMIATDAGLLDSAITLTRILLSPGERAEILLDLKDKTGQTLSLTSFSSEMPNGIYGAATVSGMMGSTIPGYNLNPLNGADFEILQLNVIAMTANPVTTLPISLTTNKPWTEYSVSRNFNLRPDFMMSGHVAGPFNINGEHFDLNIINVTVNLNDTEKWRISNNTGIAHPFHIHDTHFYLLNVNGGPVPDYEKGKKDVVLVLPNQYVEFVTKFEDFADDKVPYMYHCHLLPHEDDGMMGSFRVIDQTTGVNEAGSLQYLFFLYPNPVSDFLNIQFFSPTSDNVSLTITDVLGKQMISQPISPSSNDFQLDVSEWNNGFYSVTMKNGNLTGTKNVLVHHQ